MKLIRKIDEVVGVKFDGTLECLIEMREVFGEKFCNYIFKNGYCDVVLTMTGTGTARIGDWIVLSNQNFRIVEGKWMKNYYCGVEEL